MRQAAYCRTWKKVGATKKLEDRTINGRLVMTGFFEGSDASNLLKWRGHFTFYNADGLKRSEGNFNYGYRDGTWVYYHKGSEKVFEHIAYKNNVLAKITAFDSTGSVQSEEEFVNGIKSAFRYYENGKLSWVHTADGQTKSYYESGVLKSIVERLGGEISKEIFYNENGEVIPKADVPMFQFTQTKAHPPYDFIEYLTEKLNYPKVARKKGINGRVLVEFVIMKDGHINAAHVLEGVHPLLNEEALRVIENMPPWIPSVNNGKPVNVPYRQPINFALG